jgi:hypothetical protein
VRQSLFVFVIPDLIGNPVIICRCKAALSRRRNLYQNFTILYPSLSSIQFFLSAVDVNNKTRHTKDGDEDWTGCLWPVF